ncbi:MAG: NUDIX domain-containing protein [Chloroflexi bacterium]|nr:NUDIX domain-containing protein [Chloroflexota bacterium]
MPRFEESYLGQLRALVGNRKLITPGVRAAIQDDEGRVLLVRRKDNAEWVMPAGSVELDESVFDCLKREVKEESGLDVVSATPIAIYSEPRFSFKNAFGAEHQMLAIVFRVDEWTGTLRTETDETVEARFFPLDNLPRINAVYRETIEDLKSFNGRLILK